MSTHHAKLTAGLAAALLVCAVVPARPGQEPAAAIRLGCGEMEAFLKSAPIRARKTISVGVTLPSRATLDDGTLRHDAAIQTTDVRHATYQTFRGTELNFRDTWKFNVGGYQLARLLELNMVPPYVERTVGGVPASLSWWVPDTTMERDRLRKKITPPDPVKWNREMQAVRLFHELIADADFNATNILITRDWRVWMIDFSRAFRLSQTLQRPERITRIDPTLLGRLRGLNQTALEQHLGRWVEKRELEAVLGRRDLIVRILDDAIAARGEGAVFYELDRAREPCGQGLL